jgi:hypothetical protein
LFRRPGAELVEEELLFQKLHVWLLEAVKGLLVGMRLTLGSKEVCEALHEGVEAYASAL